MSRFVIKLRGNGDPFAINKHSIQSLIYRALGDSEYGNRHDLARFKFFTFSDTFRDRKGNIVFIVSSPSDGLINTVHRWFSSQDTIYLDGAYSIVGTKQFKLRLSNIFQTGSPVMLYRDSQSGTYFSFRDDGDIAFFLERLADNAVKKYNAFTGDDLELDEPIFDEIQLRREVVIDIAKGDICFKLLGSMWRSLVKYDMRGLTRFYEFIMDAGLGEKNSLGFGLINPVR